MAGQAILVLHTIMLTIILCSGQNTLHNMTIRLGTHYSNPITIGNRFSMHCQLSDMLDVTHVHIRWVKVVDDVGYPLGSAVSGVLEPFQSTHRYRLSASHQMTTRTYRSDLTIDSVHVDDAGYFRCEVFCEHGSSHPYQCQDSMMDNITLTVTSPNIEAEFTLYDESVNNTVTLEYTYDANSRRGRGPNVRTAVVTVSPGEVKRLKCSARSPFLQPQVNITLGQQSIVDSFSSQLIPYSVGNATQGLPTDSSQGFEVILDRSDIVLDHTWANAFLYCKITIPGVGSWQQPPELEIRVIVEGESQNYVTSGEIESSNQAYTPGSWVTMRCIFHGLSPFSTGSDYGVDFFKVVDEIEYPISVHNDDSRSSVSGMPPFDRFRMSHSQSSTEYQGNLTTQTFSKSVTLRGSRVEDSGVYRCRHLQSGASSDFQLYIVENIEGLEIAVFDSTSTQVEATLDGLVTVALGDTITIQCVAPVSNPPADMEIFFGEMNVTDTFTRQVTSTIQTGQQPQFNYQLYTTTYSRADIVVTEMWSDALIKCNAILPYLSSYRQRNTARAKTVVLQVEGVVTQYAPQISVTPVVEEVNLYRTARLTCVIDNTNPVSPPPLWTRRTDQGTVTLSNSGQLHQQYTDLHRYSVVTTNMSTLTNWTSTMMYVSKFTIYGVRIEDAGTYVCTDTMTRQEQTAELKVIANPRKLHVSVFQDWMKNPVEDKDQFTLSPDHDTRITCTAERSIPVAQMVVRIGDQDLTSLFTLTSEMVSEEVAGGFTRMAHNTVASGTLQTQKLWNQKYLVCEAMVDEDDMEPVDVAPNSDIDHPPSGTGVPGPPPGPAGVPGPSSDERGFPSIGRPGPRPETGSQGSQGPDMYSAPRQPLPPVETQVLITLSSQETNALAGDRREASETDKQDTSVPPDTDSRNQQAQTKDSATMSSTTPFLLIILLVTLGTMLH